MEVNFPALARTYRKIPESLFAGFIKYCRKQKISLSVKDTKAEEKTLLSVHQDLSPLCGVQRRSGACEKTLSTQATGGGKDKQAVSLNPPSTRPPWSVHVPFQRCFRVLIPLSSVSFAAIQGRLQLQGRSTPPTMTTIGYCSLGC